MNSENFTTSIPATRGIAYSVLLERSEDDARIWTAEIPVLGIVTEGRGRAAAERAARKAVEGWVIVAQRHDREVPAGDLQLMSTTTTSRHRGRMMLDVFAKKAVAKKATAKKTARKKVAAKKVGKKKAAPAKRRNSGGRKAA